MNEWRIDLTDDEAEAFMSALADDNEDPRARAWDECNAMWAKRGLTPDFPNPYRA